MTPSLCFTTDFLSHFQPSRSHRSCSQLRWAARRHLLSAGISVHHQLCKQPLFRLIYLSCRRPLPQKVPPVQFSLIVCVMALTVTSTQSSGEKNAIHCCVDGAPHPPALVCWSSQQRSGWSHHLRRRGGQPSLGTNSFMTSFGALWFLPGSSRKELPRRRSSRRTDCLCIYKRVHNKKRAAVFQREGRALTF